MSRGLIAVACLIAACLMAAAGLAALPAAQAAPKGTRAPKAAAAQAPSAAAPAVPLHGDPQSIEPGDGFGRLTYFVTAGSPSPERARAAIVALHGRPRDATRTLEAAERATRLVGRIGDTLVVAPLFQVGKAQAGRCDSPGNPPAQPGDMLWACGSWFDGGLAENGRQTSFAAMDRLLADLKRRWPALETITLAGFSAGGQFVQHYVGFAKPPEGLRMRYVIADPGTWLYFHDRRPQPTRRGLPADWSDCTADGDISGGCGFNWVQPDAQACPESNRWKYGLDGIPAPLSAAARGAAERYASADIVYLLGANDHGEGPGTFAGILDQSCAAKLQGPWRLQRGLAFWDQERRHAAPGAPRSYAIAAGCAHDVGCVLPSPEARGLLFAR